MLLVIWDRFGLGCDAKESRNWQLRLNLSAWAANHRESVTVLSTAPLSPRLPATVPGARYVIINDTNLTNLALLSTRCQWSCIQIYEVYYKSTKSGPSAFPPKPSVRSLEQANLIPKGTRISFIISRLAADSPCAGQCRRNCVSHSSWVMTRWVPAESGLTQPRNSRTARFGAQFESKKLSQVPSKQWNTCKESEVGGPIWTRRLLRR